MLYYTDELSNDNIYIERTLLIQDTKLSHDFVNYPVIMSSLKTLFM